jgi:nucleoside-diphosphate-sugar epimerase
VSRVLITGASGFVGRFAVEALKGRGFDVHGVARRPPENVLIDGWHEANLLEPSAPAQVVREAGATHLLHLAWTTEHGRYWEDAANRDWISATRRLIKAFAEAGGSRFVLAGSCAQYDWSTAEPLSERETPRRPATLYGRAKEETAELLESSSAEVGVSTATGLLFFPYGPHEWPQRLVSSVARHLLAGEEAPVSAGMQVRDFLHVTDCGAALAALLDSEVAGPVNVGSGEGTPVADVAESVAGIVGCPELLRLGALPGDDETRVVAATERLRDEVGFVPRFGLEEGLRDTVEWWRQRMRRR